MMVKINAQILDGNMCDGWSDNYVSAMALADFTKNVWMNDIVDLGFDVEIEIDVASSTCGCPREVSVFADAGDYGVIRVIEDKLTSANEIWVMFCASGEAASMFCQ